MAREKRHTLDNLLNVKTPENISFQYRIAGPFRRLIAFFLDLIISQVCYWFLVILIMIGVGLLSSMAGPQVAELVTGTLSGIFLSIGFFVWWFYGAIMETYWNGQTYGKKFMNLRALRVNGEAIDGTQALLRNFFRLMDCCPFVGMAVMLGPDIADEFLGQAANAGAIPSFMVGLIVMSVSSRYQRVGDLVAGTIVVHEQKRWEHGLAKFEDPRVAQLAELLPHDFFVAGSMAKALASYVDRRRVLPYQRVNEIAGHLAKPLLQKFGLPMDTNHDLLLCALYFKTYMSQTEENIEPVNPVIAVQTTANQSGYGSNIGYG